MFGWLSRAFADPSIALANALCAGLDREAEKAGKTCDICHGVRYECPTCHEEIESHSHEGDYRCRSHGFVDPIRCSDGARINGNGRGHQRVLETA